MKVSQCTCWLVVTLAIGAATRLNCPAADFAVAPLVQAINAVGPEGQNHRRAIEAWQQLVQADVGQLPEILAGFQVDAPLSSNWLRSAVETIAQRQLDAGGQLPAQQLEEFLLDTSHAPRARRVSYELLLRVDPEVRQRLIPKFLNDPSLELRRDAVADALAQADALLATDRTRAAAAYREALTAARDSDQVDRAAEKLKDLGEKVDLPRHFGFITKWKLIAPFDNVNMRGFDVAYGPEVNLDPEAEYKGKEGVVRWVERSTEDPYGTVDLNELLGRFKGAIAYAYAEFYASQPRDVELRLGCINGNKIWLNGDLLTANHVYHSGTYMDQYVGKGRLKAGKNVILLKIAQNEQTESWAQRWQFQLRVCDQYGTAVLSEE